MDDSISTHYRLKRHFNTTPTIIDTKKLIFRTFVQIFPKWVSQKKTKDKVFTLKMKIKNSFYLRERQNKLNFLALCVRQIFPRLRKQWWQMMPNLWSKFLLILSLTSSKSGVIVCVWIQCLAELAAFAFYTSWDPRYNV